MKKNLCFHLLCIFCFALLLCVPSISVKAESKRTVRVGYPISTGLSMKDDDDGRFYGYDYDYLMQVAQYTGWEFDFVEVNGSQNEQLTTLLNMLKNGEIDLLGGTRYFESLTGDYDYASEPYGSSYNVIAVKNDSELMDVNSLIAKKDLKIGVLETAAARIELLDQHAQTNGFSYEKVFCDDEEDLKIKYNNHEVDAILSVDLSLPSDYHAIVKFSPTAFYFITTKGNTQVMTELNHALVNISQINPTLSSNLYNRYFGGNTTDFVLNTNETAYIKDHPDISILLSNGISPINHGVSKDILDKLSADTGIEFHYTSVENFETFKKKALNDEYDIVLGLPYEASLANNLDIHMSDPYMTSTLMLITNKDVSPADLDGKKQAITPYSVTLYDQNENLDYFETKEETLNAVNRHEVDYTYLSNYVLTYYMNKNNYENISTFNTADYLRTQYVFGVTKKDDLALVSILNKAIRTQKDDIESYIYKNAYVEKEFNLLAFIKEHILVLCCIALIVILAVFSFIRSYYRKQLRLKKDVELEYMRYQMLSDLSGEAMFTYDYLEDSMKISASGLNKLAGEETIPDFSTAVHDVHLYPDIMRIIASHLANEKDVTSEEESRTLHNSEKWYQLSIKVIKDTRDNKTAAIYAVGKVLDIQKTKEEHEQLRIKSETDTLTGIMNRGAAQEAITGQIAHGKGIGALLMIDLDNFKYINDTFGHIEGDRLLIETAQLLVNIFTPHIVARLGGDEFIIYVNDTSKEEVSELSSKVLKQVEELPSMQNHDVTVTMSIGIAFTSCSKDFVTLMRLADQMLYEVKGQGRNNFKICKKNELI